MKRKTIKFSLITFSFVFFATLSFLILKNGNESQAASTANFNAGNIISDYMMGNYTSMTEAEIQSFLKSKVSCDKAIPSSYKNEGNGVYSTTFSSGGKTYYYHGKNGKFVCLPDEKFGEGINYGENVKNGETAAHIIWQAAQDYKINPQALIVLLEKEQSLITDKWPNNYQYRSATGYGCPDTAACDSKYYGFKNQVRSAANLFRTVLNGGWTNYPLGKNYIKYNPDASCGGSTVDIKNLATSALYRYTPYQPNAAALAAGYGTAACGAYGNRNFYLFFYDWFGDPTIDKSTAKAEPKGATTTSEKEAAAKKINEVEKYIGKKFGNKINGISINSATGIYWQEYERGFIVGTDKTGYYESTGKIRDLWASRGFESGVFGFPISNIENNPETGVLWQYYIGGTIVGDDRTGYYESRGAIRDFWAKTGFEYGMLGKPISNIDTNTKTGIIFQEYERGFIVGTGKTGYYESMGKIREYWASNNFESGWLGLPTSTTVYKNGIYTQEYQNGTVSYNTKTDKTTTTKK